MADKLMGTRDALADALNQHATRINIQADQPSSPKAGDTDEAMIAREMED
eukprot:gene51301-29025_t